VIGKIETNENEESSENVIISQYHHPLNDPRFEAASSPGLDSFHSLKEQADRQQFNF
jgi:hypothetical protein